MKARGFVVSALAVFLCPFCVSLAAAAQTLSPVILPEENPQTPENYVLIWDTDPGVRYEVRESGDLKAWSVVDGYPLAAVGITQQMPLTAEDQVRFFQTRALDEQPPAVMSRSPDDGDYAVRRTESLTIELTDATGIDPDSLSLRVGDLGSFTLSDPSLSFADGVVTFTNDGSVAWGAYGVTVPVSLSAADMLGNRGTNAWSFDLEAEARVVTNLLVFGSSQALRAGQRLEPTPMAAVARRYGGAVAVRAPADPWSLESVEPDRLIVAYADTAPAVSVGTYVCNLAPRNVAEIFYRKVSDTTDDSVTRRLTLMTQEVPLEELIEQGSLGVSGESAVLSVDEAGVVHRAVAFGTRVTFPRLGFSLDGSSFTLGDNPVWLNLTAEELHWWLTPSIGVTLDFKRSELQRFKGAIRGDLDSAIVLGADVLLLGAAAEVPIFDLPEASEPSIWIFLGTISWVPVYAQVKFDLKVIAEAEAQARLAVRAGLRQSASAEFGIDYERAREPAVKWIRDVTFAPTEIVRPEAALAGELSLKLKLEPSVSFLVYGLAGAEASLAPRGGIVVETDFAGTLTGRLEADVSLNFRPDGLALAWLKPKPTLSLSLWEDQWHLFPEAEKLAIVKQPGSAVVPEGQSARFSVTANRTAGVSYQWFHDATPLPHQTQPHLDLFNVGESHAGEYFVRVRADHESVDSAAATLVVTAAGEGVPAGDGFTVPGFELEMVWLDPGTFTMGSLSTEQGRGSDEEPQAQVTLTKGFWLGKYEVTQREYQELMGTNPSSFQGDLDRPVEQVSRNDAVAYCEKLTEHTRAAGWLPGGYEFGLPTEAQWEYACRAGTTTRFSFGDALQCNDYCLFCPEPDDCMVWCGNDNGRTERVGTRLPNPWGFHDLHGNVQEWCADWYAEWYGRYPGGSVTDPQGPASGSNRVLRGGGWSDPAQDCRSASRDGNNASNPRSDLGFRVALVPVEVLIPPNPDTERFVWIAPGTFTMGSPESERGRKRSEQEGPSGPEGPQTQVTLTQGFWLGKYEVTIDEYRVFLLAGGDQSGVDWTPYSCPIYRNATFSLRRSNYYIAEHGDQPMVSVSWHGAVSYCEWLTLHERSAGRLPGGYEYGLPTEAQWEYACRAGTTTRFSFGDALGCSDTWHFCSEMDAYMVWSGNHPDGTEKVGTRLPNPWGLYDMHGNVWEWCADWLGTYPGGEVSDPEGPASASQRAFRGGNWSYWASECRSAWRTKGDPTLGGFYRGFRVALIQVP